MPAGEHLVHVRLVPGVPHDRVVRRLEHAVQRDGQLDHAKVRPKMAAGAADRLDEPLADLRRERRQRRLGQCPNVGRSGDPIQQ